MPSKIGKKVTVTYDVDVKLPSVGIEKQAVLNEETLRKLYAEVDQLCLALADALGDIRLTKFKSPIQHAPREGGSASKVLEYAKTVTDFTIKGACEALNMQYQTVYEASEKLVDDGLLTKTATISGVANLYRLKPQPQQKDKIPAIEVFPEGKVPFPSNTPNPESEKIRMQKDSY